MIYKEKIDEVNFVKTENFILYKTQLKDKREKL